MQVFAFENYRKFIQAKLEASTYLGRGELGKIANHLEVNNSYLTQVLNGDKNFSPEQGFLLANYFQMNELETRYFNALITLDRATKTVYKKFLLSELEKMRQEANGARGIPPIDQPLDVGSQATFYSSWIYSAVQLWTGVEAFETAEALQEKLKLDKKTVKEILDFLVLTGLCTTDGTRFKVGKRRTHLSEDSSFLKRHHMNWRLQGFDRMENKNPSNYFYTAPMRVDKKTAAKIELKIRDFMREVNSMISAAGDETVACLNIDWFGL